MPKKFLIYTLTASLLSFFIGTCVAYYTANYQVQIDLNSGQIRGVYSVCGISTHKASDFQYNYIGGLIAEQPKWHRLYDQPNIHQRIPHTVELLARHIFIAGNLVRVMPEVEARRFKDKFVEIVNTKGNDAAFRYLEDVEKEFTRKYRKGDDWRHLEPVIPFSSEALTDTQPEGNHLN